MSGVPEPTGPADRFLQQSSDDSSALQTSVVLSATERGLFVSLIWCPPGSSRAGEDNWAQSTNIQGGQPPPQIPFEFIHLCFPKRAHPHVSAHNSDAFMRDAGVYRVTSRQYDMNQLLSYQSPIWCSWFRNSCSIPYLSVPSLWHGELQDTRIWRPVRRFFTGSQRLLSLLKTEISCVKTNEALLVQL